MAAHRHFHSPRQVDDSGHAPQDPEMPRLVKREPATIVSVVYVTAAPTFEGPVGGYTTIGVPFSKPSPTPRSSQRNSQRVSTTRSPQTTEEADSRATPAIQIQSSTDVDIISDVRSTADESSSSSSTSSAISSTESRSSSSRTSSTATSSFASSTSDPASRVSAVTSSSFSSTPTASPSTETSSGGMTGGARAGLALGIIIALGAILGVIYFCLRRKRNANRAQALIDDEKTTSGAGGMAERSASVRTTRTAANAPRLSLRPVTQFDPHLAGERRSAANLLTRNGPAGANGASSMGTGPAMVQPAANGMHANPQNPFGAHAETSTGPANVTNPSPMASNPTNAGPNTTANRGEMNVGVAHGGPSAVPAGLGIGATVVAAAASASSASLHQQLPKADRSAANAPMNPNEPLPLPPVNIAAANAMRNASPQSSISIPAPGSPRSVAGSADTALQATPVHRVQLDFNPSMDDELELRTGQLVRLLHAYDDGWALCIRLDRSQQGVAPRTCLSEYPVKPRPMGPPPAGSNSPRGTPPPPGWRPPMQGPGMQGRPGSPANTPPGSSSARPWTPSGGPNGRQSPGPYTALHPRPLSPASGRNSPGPQGRPASPAMSGGPRYAPAPYRAPPRPASPAGSGRQSPTSRDFPPPATSPRSGTPVGPGSRGSPLGHSPSPSQHQSPQRLPTVLRSGSPGPQGRPASPAPGTARKPVPGQAL
ncbi:MAG: coiled-coil domain-containing protein mad1 [Watsoniomyces obsoletus]|nr:MAG: coiled-coil domain-containing protein mad1 [Watsoniomyces obsoletus]